MVSRYVCQGENLVARGVWLISVALDRSGEFSYFFLPVSLHLEFRRGNICVSHGGMLIYVYVLACEALLCVDILCTSNSKTKLGFFFSLFSCLWMLIWLCVCVSMNICNLCASVWMNLYMCMQAGSGSPTMAAAIQDFQRSESDRLNEVKGHLEIALLEKHFLRKYTQTHVYHVRHGLY